MSQASIRNIVNKTAQLYSLPDIYTKLDNAINDPASELQDIVNILLEDSGISARVLKLANSAFYSFPSKVDTISRAITIIGTKQLRDIVLGTCVMKLFSDIPKDVVDMDSFWRHSVATGICARVIATYYRKPNVERFYLMGLLHDIGRLIMYIQVPEKMGEQLQFCRENKAMLYRTEQEKLGFDHAAVGEYLLEVWKLPEPIQKAVGSHHNPKSSEDAAIIHLSDIIVNVLQLGSSGEHFVPQIDEKAWQTLNLKSSQIPLIVEQVERQYHDIIDEILL